MDPRLRVIVDRIKAREAQRRRTNPPVIIEWTVSQQLQRDVVTAGLKHAVQPDELADACEELGIDYHVFTGEFVTWL